MKKRKLLRAKKRSARASHFFLYHMRGLGRFRNSQQAFPQGVKVPRPSAFLAVRHMTICSKMVDYISGHKQFDVASAISNYILSENSSV